MRALVQRVSEARVRVERRVTGEIGAGLLVLVGVTHDDDTSTAEKLAEKVWRLRIMDDGAGRMDLGVAETTGAVLVVSQFTLYGDTRKGRRPSWVRAAPPEHAEPLVEAVAEALRSRGAEVATGAFGARMEVELVNEGPVTLLVEVGAAGGAS